MKIVRTIGQVFEVCHKLSFTYSNQQASEVVGHSGTSTNGKCVETDTPIKTGSLVQIDDDRPNDSSNHTLDSNPAKNSATTRGLAITGTTSATEPSSSDHKNGYATIEEEKTKTSRKMETRSTGCQVGSSVLATPLMRDCEVNRQLSSILQRLESQLSDLTNRIETIEDNQTKMLDAILRIEQFNQQRWAATKEGESKKLNAEADASNSDAIESIGSAPGLSSSVTKQRDSLFSPPSLGFDSPEKSLSIFSSGKHCILSHVVNRPSLVAIN